MFYALLCRYLPRSVAAMVLTISYSSLVLLILLLMGGPEGDFRYVRL